MRSLSRATKIIVLLIIDTIFFLVELVIGYAVGSLALVADSFHMLNDILSLVVALYAIRLSSRNTFDTRYSYGWHRAEILAALINGVFLLALCFSIFMEAVERFFSTPEITNPKLVVIVGTFGLASNILGLFIFNEHGHSHEKDVADESVDTQQNNPNLESYGTFSFKPKSEPDREPSDPLYGHPAATRAYFVHAASELQRARSRSRSRDAAGSLQPSHIRRKRSEADAEIEIANPSNEDSEELSEERSLITESSEMGSRKRDRQLPSSNSRLRLSDDDDRRDLESRGVASTHSHSHSHGSMNMQALVLHVFGDALGNIGVIVTGLVIWLTTWSWRFYFDPIISLLITVIIFSSALPLVKSASFILLQAVPSGISVEDVSDAIYAVEGVKSVHELHIWQLSENKVVASVHVLTSQDHDFMTVAAEIRKALHDRGIHSSTIQPEFSNNDHLGHLVPHSESACLIPCPPGQNCDPSQNACCPPPPQSVP